MLKIIKESSHLPSKIGLGILVCLLAALPRLLSLQAGWASDEEIWLRRSQNFVGHLQKSNDFRQTVVSPHPGVTTMWLGGMGLWRKYGFDGALNLSATTFLSPPTLAAARMPIALTAVCTIVVMFYLLWKLLGVWRALLSTLLIAFDPFYLFFSRTLLTDGLAASFTVLSVLALLIYLETSPRWGYFVFSGICFGLACLSKVNSLVLVLFLPFLLFFYWKCPTTSLQNKTRRPTSLLYLFAAFLGIAFITFICVCPVFWTLKINVGEFPVPVFGFIFFGTLGVVLFSIDRLNSSSDVSRKWIHSPISQGIQLMLAIGVISIVVVKGLPVILQSVNWASKEHEVSFLYFGKIVHDPGLFFYPAVLSFRTTLFALPLTLIGVVGLIYYRSRIRYSKKLRVFLTICIFIVLFVLCMSFAAKKLSKYILPVFPLLDILAAMSLYECLKRLRLKVLQSKNQLSRFLTKRLVPLVVLVVVLLAVLSLEVLPVLSLHPNYLAYYNPLWRVTDVSRLFSVGGVTGLDLAGKYLNNLEDARDISVRTSPVMSLFLRYYFPGKIVPWDDESQLLAPDYEVLHLYDRQCSQHEFKWPCKLEHSISINGINYVDIYKVITEE